MIQKLQESDTMQVMEIWLGGNKDAHPYPPGVLGIAPGDGA